MMKPILFNTEMVRSLLARRKSVTRRVVKPQPEGKPYPMPSGSCWPGYFGTVESARVFAPPYRPGDILYVRETWATWSRTYGTVPKLYYRADGDAPDGIKWRPSIHMPKEAARLFLRVTGVRVERLQDIAEEQAEAEGCSKWCEGTEVEIPASSEFCDLWDNTIKKADLPLYGWAANPWVWVIEFERISKEEALK